MWSRLRASPLIALRPCPLGIGHKIHPVGIKPSGSLITPDKVEIVLNVCVSPLAPTCLHPPTGQPWESARHWYQFGARPQSVPPLSGTVPQAAISQGLNKLWGFALTGWHFLYEELGSWLRNRSRWHCASHATGTQTPGAVFGHPWVRNYPASRVWTCGKALMLRWKLWLQTVDLGIQSLIMTYTYTANVLLAR